MRSHSNEFILIIHIARRKVADFERPELESGLEFGPSSFTKRNNFSEGSSELKKYAQVIQVRGPAAPRIFLTRITYFCTMRRACICAEGLSWTSCKLMNEYLCTSHSTCVMCIHVVAYQFHPVRGSFGEHHSQTFICWGKII